MKRRAAIFALGCAATMGVAAAMRPSRRAAEVYLPIQLDSQIPLQFSDWRLDPSIAPVLPDPSLQAKLDQIYSQTLARTYVNEQGQRVMLSIAYGGDQGTDSTQAHRPEFCYTSQGFSVSRIGSAVLDLGSHQIVVSRLLGRMGGRFEPITYWMTLNDKAILPGVTRKLAQIRFGLGGLIPDGMLVRVSTIGYPEAKAFEIQQTFLLDLHAAIRVEAKSRYFGR